jgi:hypothetical protein
MKRFNSKGETLIELLTAVAVLSLILMVIFQIFISGKKANQQAWQLTMENELAVQIIEQLKAMPYSTLREWEQTYRSGGPAAGLDPRDGRFGLTIDPMFDGLSAEFALLPYGSYSLDRIMEVVVRVGRTEVSSLIRAGDS